MKKGFTLIELLVVIGMIAILVAAASSSVMQARKRSQIARAETEVREMTNAILAYENYDKEHSLDRFTTSGGSNWPDAKKSDLGFILGEGTDEAGNKIPVLFNASISGEYIVDPWGTPYQYKIAKTGRIVDDSKDKVGKNLETFVYLPNLYWHRAK